MEHWISTHPILLTKLGGIKYGGLVMTLSSCLEAISKFTNLNAWVVKPKSNLALIPIKIPKWDPRGG